MRRALCAALILAVAAVALAAAGLLPARVAEASRLVEQVRGRRFERVVPASEMDTVELRRVLQKKLAEGFPATPKETFRSLAALGLLEDRPDLYDRLLEFYISQVIAFYDPEPRRFYLVRGGEDRFGEGDMAGMADRLILSHELTHALQDENLRLDRRFRDLRDNTDATLALECLLEGEATIVMVRTALAQLGGEGEEVEEMLEPLLSAGALERANVPKDVPDFFVEQLFFPYVEGTAYVRRALSRGGWGQVDRLWKSPPLSTAEILHEGRTGAPERDLLPAALDGLSPAGLRPLFADTFGEWMVRFLLRRTLEEAEADEAAAGWRGDRIAFFSSPKAVAYLWRLRLESPIAAARFETAWKKARPARPGETVWRSGRDVVVTSGFEKLPPLPGLPNTRSN